jgi:hypothetical protein
MSISAESETPHFRDSEAHNNLQKILQSCPKVRSFVNIDYIFKEIDLFRTESRYASLNLKVK